MIDAAGYRKVIGTFATGVTVITSEVDGVLRVYRPPSPASLSTCCCCRVDKRAHAMASRPALRFGVSILAEDQRSLQFVRESASRRSGRRGAVFRRGRTACRRRVCALSRVRGCGSTAAITIYPTGGEGVIVGDARPLAYYQGSYRTIA
jgi:hypothetical protein